MTSDVYTAGDNKELIKLTLRLAYSTHDRGEARHVRAAVPGWAGLAGSSQHLASVAFISSNKLLSSVESLHFPSTETEFSPFFTRRQTWWPWMERLYMEAQESTRSTTEKWW